MSLGAAIRELVAEGAEKAKAARPTSLDEELIGFDGEVGGMSRHQGRGERIDWAAATTE